jgi:hypothetical protein
MNARKSILLSLALLLPIAIFLFLKFFGKNEFAVPAFYQDSKPKAPSGCSYEYAVPYLVPDSLMARWRSKGAGPLYLINYGKADDIQRVTLKYRSDIQIVSGTESPSERQCALLATDIQDLVLVDDVGAIRGYYTSDDREEIDRLILEIDIILKRY